MSDARQPARQVGRYRILSRLGQGAMANVYRAHDPEIQRDLAIKILNQQFRRDPDCVARFLREARAAGSLSHANIVTIYDVGEAEGFPYLAMELLVGETLDSAIAARGARPATDVIDIGIQLAEALHYAHGLGIVHRDVKPSNIHLGADGRTVKLLDFGIARVAEAGQGEAQTLKTQIGQVLGTPRYMSPEQALGQPLDGRSDLFSLGAILYELITGRPAFDGTSLATLALQITSQQPAPIDVVPECPRGLRFIIDKLLAKQAEKRFADGAQLAKALRAEAASLKTVAREDRVRRLPLHLRFTLAAGVTAMAVLLAGIGWVLDRQYAAMERVAMTAGSSIASFVASNTALPLMENASVPPEQADWLPVQAFVKTASADPNIRDLTVVDANGIVRASARTPLIGTHYYAPPGQSSLTSGGDVAVSRESDAGREFFRFTRSVAYGNRIVGQVDVRVEKSALQTASAETTLLMAGLGALMFAVAVGLSFLAGRHVIGPVRRLNAALRDAAAGKLDFRISHRRRDEFGELFDNFNALAANVQDSRQPSTGVVPDPGALLRDVAATIIHVNAGPQEKRA